VDAIQLKNKNPGRLEWGFIIRGKNRKKLTKVTQGPQGANSEICFRLNNNNEETSKGHQGGNGKKRGPLLFWVQGLQPNKNKRKLPSGERLGKNGGPEQSKDTTPMGAEWLWTEFGIGAFCRLGVERRTKKTAANRRNANTGVSGSLKGMD